MLISLVKMAYTVNGSVQKTFIGMKKEFMTPELEVNEVAFEAIAANGNDTDFTSGNDGWD